MSIILKNVSSSYAKKIKKNTVNKVCAGSRAGNDFLNIENTVINSKNEEGVLDGFILQDISYEFETGKSLAVLGQNGSGKTTLLRTIAGLISYEGEILIDGKDLRKMKREEIASKIGFFSQIQDVNFSFSVYDTVMLGRYIYSKHGLKGPSKEDKEKVDEALERTGLYQVKDRMIDELSGGQRQRVFLARTFAQDTPFILLDEPTNHLDIKYQSQIMDYLKEWEEESERHTLIGVYHNIEIACKTAENLIFLKDGKLLKSGKKKDVLSKELLYNIYGVDVAAILEENYKAWADLLKK